MRLERALDVDGATPEIHPDLRDSRILDGAQAHGVVGTVLLQPVLDGIREFFIGNRHDGQVISHVPGDAGMTPEASKTTHHSAITAGDSCA